jgi:hypothetical protein
MGEAPFIPSIGGKDLPALVAKDDRDNAYMSI